MAGLNILINNYTLFPLFCSQAATALPLPFAGVVLNIAVIPIRIRHLQPFRRIIPNLSVFTHNIFKFIISHNVRVALSHRTCVELPSEHDEDYAYNILFVICNLICAYSYK